VSPQPAQETVLSLKSTNTSLVLDIYTTVEDMMMHLPFLQTSYPVATTVDTRYVNAYGTTRDAIGPVKLQIIIVIYIYCIIHLKTMKEKKKGDDITSILKNMKEWKKGDDSRSISCFVHSHASLYL